VSGKVSLTPTGQPGRRSGLLAGLRTGLRSPAVTAVVIAFSLLWSIPTMGLAITSLRPSALAESSAWWTVLADPQFTLDNYRAIFTAGVLTPQGAPPYLINTVVIAVPSVLLPLVLGFMAAYALAWIPFRGSQSAFLLIVGLQVIPAQMLLLPLVGLLGQGYPAIWAVHTILALPLAVYLLYAFVSAVPRDLLQGARLDGAGHLVVLTRIVLPLCAPAIAAFAVVQFVWVWNDLLVALTFAGTSPEVVPITAYLASVKAANPDQPARIAALACIAILVPSLVVALVQRTFTRGLAAGSVQG